MKYGPDMTRQISELLSQGMNRTDTCDLVGISYETFTVWMQKPEFSDAIKKGEMLCKQRNIVRIQNASRKSWQAAAWWLERKFSEEFALTSKMQLAGPRGGPIRVSMRIPSMVNLTDEALERLAFDIPKALNAQDNDQA